jgi:hypothetical protein
MGRMLRAVGLVLLWGPGAGGAALLAGTVWINTTAGGIEGAEAMGRAILVIFYLTPAAVVLGALGGAVAAWRAQ